MRAPLRVLSVRRPSPPMLRAAALAPGAREPAEEAGARGCSGALRTMAGGRGGSREGWERLLSCHEPWQVKRVRRAFLSLSLSLLDLLSTKLITQLLSFPRKFACQGLVDVVRSL